jgi:hypothetical protein
MNVCGKEITTAGRLLRVGRLAADGYEFLDDPDAAIAGLRAQRGRIDVFTFAQELPDTARKHAFPMEWDNVAAVPVSTFEHWRARQIKDKTRNMLRRADKSGLVVRAVPFDDALVRGIAAIYDESPMRQGRRFKHYGKSLEQVRRENATFLERSVFLGAFVGEDLVGFAKLVKARHQAALMQILSMIAHRDKAPTNALIARAVGVCEEQQVPYLVYGRFSYGRKEADPLSDFKRHNGFERVDVPRYYAALTPVGTIALRLGLHHGLGAYVPQAVVDRFRKVRARWWARRFPVAKATA